MEVFGLAPRPLHGGRRLVRKDVGVHCLFGAVGAGKLPDLPRHAAAGGHRQPGEVVEQKFGEVSARIGGEPLARGGAVGGVRLVLRFGRQVVRPREEGALEVFLQRRQFQRPRDDAVFGQH